MGRGVDDVADSEPLEPLTSRGNTKTVAYLHLEAITYLHLEAVGRYPDLDCSLRTTVGKVTRATLKKVAAMEDLGKAV